MKIIIKMAAVRLATVGLALVALAAPTRAGRLLPNGLSTSNGLAMVVSQVNGFCPSTIPCSSAA